MVNIKYGVFAGKVENPYPRVPPDGVTSTVVAPER
jgi:hypothetical protein